MIAARARRLPEVPERAGGWWGCRRGQGLVVVVLVAVDSVAGVEMGAKLRRAVVAPKPDPNSSTRRPMRARIEGSPGRPSHESPPPPPPPAPSPSPSYSGWWPR